MEHKLLYIQTDSEFEIKIFAYRRKDNMQQSQGISSTNVYGTIANDLIQIS